MKTETVNLQIFHVELESDYLVLYGTRGKEKHYKVKVKLDKNWKAESIAINCLLRVKKIIAAAHCSINKITETVDMFNIHKS